MNISEERLNFVLKNIANQFGSKNWSYTQSDKDEIIENYCSVLVPVTFVETDDKGEIRTPIFMKFLPTDVIEVNKGIIKQNFEVEEYAYRYLFPIYERVSNLNIHSFIPQSYYTDLKPSKEVIVMKDMRSEGFKRYDEEGFLDYNHVRLSLEVLAKFHALSVMYKEKGGEFEFDNEMENKILQPYSEKQDYLYHLQIKKAIKNKIGLFLDTVYGDYLKKIESSFDDYVLSATTDIKLLVYGHGDFWKDNILFKYKDSEPVKACLIDFQKVRRLSPAVDILLFMLTSVGVTDINQHNEYLRIYLDKFQSILNENGIDCTYSIDDLNHDMKVVAPYCISIAVMSFTLWLGLEFDNFLVSKNVSINQEENTNKLKNIIINFIKQFNSFGYVHL